MVFHCRSSHVSSPCAAASAEQKTKFAPLKDLSVGDDSAVSVRDLQALSELYRALCLADEAKYAAVDPELDCGRGYVHELAMGSSVIAQRPPEEPKKARTRPLLLSLLMGLAALSAGP